MSKDNIDKVRPFSNGTEFEMWNSRNCDECNISTSYRNSGKFICHIDEALIVAYFDDGKIDKNIADKIGFDEKYFFKNCHFKNAYDLKQVSINTTVFKHQQLSFF